MRGGLRVSSLYLSLTGAGIEQSSSEAHRDLLSSEAAGGE